jgi:hypothetical protein
MHRIVLVLILLVSASVWAANLPAEFCGKKDVGHCDRACLISQTPNLTKCMGHCREHGVLCGPAAEGTPQQGLSKAEVDARVADSKKSLCMTKATRQCRLNCRGKNPEARSACQDECSAKGEAACGK